MYIVWVEMTLLVSCLYEQNILCFHKTNEQKREYKNI